MAATAHAISNASTDRTAITYRPIRRDDIDVIVEQFYLTWGVAEPGDPDIARMTSRHFTLHYLEPATRGDIAEGPDGTFMGVTLARVAGRPVLFPEVSDELAHVDAALNATAQGADALARTNAWHRVEERMEDDVAVNERAGAELELFLVAPAARGHGVGGTLWRRLLAYFAHQGVERYYLHTDSSCDVGFYEHKGLTRTAERLAADHPEEPAGDGEDLFIYEGAVEAAPAAREDGEVRA
ncbi:GNAT family N-acetyltransferase [Bifidobacterium sp. MA2]|uniref:GNAT family N-acetyltransferase n=1 Tax=Bifidobacterium santillanense TaxID=2809028 RepID=A0ABS5UPM8_9BIFI|nr:GNAT family N-acetyltransferase [Bifidobacterium santillanense]MBT1172832.1 GNAT family N-acetyltransferase [Bifidobacterium santillanense]